MEPTPHARKESDENGANVRTIGLGSNSATPLCPYFGQCGGCSAQHILYETQIENKKKLASTTSGFPLDKIEVHSGSPYHYRNRMDFIFHSKGIGLRKRERHQEIVDISECAISDPQLNKLIKEVRDFFTENVINKQGSIDAFEQKRMAGTYKYVVIRAPTNTSSISFTLNTNSTKIDEATQLIEKFAKITTAKSVLIAYVPAERDDALSDEFVVVKGSDMIEETMLGKKLTYSTQAFFQNNSAMANEMVQYARTIIENYPNHEKYNLLDLYGGVGTFGICIADLVKSTHIVECVQQAIDAANLNIERNSTPRATAQVLDATNIKKLVGKPVVAQPLIVITDPPRSGMDNKTIECLNKQLQPELLIYISCNPHQMEKELPRLTNYQAERVAMFDLFPQTNHLEVVVVLKKKQVIA